MHEGTEEYAGGWNDGFEAGSRWGLELAANIACSWSERGFGFSEEVREYAKEIAADIRRRLTQ